MSRNLKALGLALVAAFAMSAIASSAASATEATFTSATNWTTLDASSVGIQRFKIEGEAEEFSCNSVSFDGATVGTDQNSITATPTYGTTLANNVTEAVATTSGCSILAGGVVRPATAHTENCHLTFTAGSKEITGDGEVNITGTNEPPTCEIKITIYFLGEFKPCYDIHDQTPTVPTVDYTNGTYIAGAGSNVWDVTVKSTVRGLTYHRTGVCLFNKPTEANNAEYTGEVTIKGTDTENNPANVTWDKKT